MYIKRRNVRSNVDWHANIGGVMNYFDEYIERSGTDSVKYARYADDVIPMWVADTDFRAPREVIDALVERAVYGIYGYRPVSEQLKLDTSRWVSRYGMDVQPELVAFCPGVIPGVICAIRSFSEPGDEIIVQTPAYSPFYEAIMRNGRTVSRNPMILRDGNYELDFDGFEQLCKRDRARIFILCNPQNPTGRVFTEEELTRLGDICLKNDIVILSDEIHADIIKEGHRHIPIAGISEKLAQKTISFVAVSKTFNLPGLNTASYYTKNPEFLKAVEAEKYAAKEWHENIFGTLAACVSYEKCAYYVEELNDYLDKNDTILREKMKSVPGIKVMPREGTFLTWLDCRELQLSQEELMARFIEKAKVGIQSGTDFGEDGTGFVRLNIGCPKVTLIKAIDRIISEFC